jgi:Aminoglycoside-2''-adenylyltransferase
VDVGAGQQLAQIAAIGQLLDAAGFDHWLFGGWAVDFYVGAVTRSHGDIDFAVWLRDAPSIAALLEAEGWRHAPNEDEDGGTGYVRNEIRVELTFLIEGDRGEVLIAFRAGPAVWSSHTLGSQTLALAGVRCRVIPLAVLRAGKSVPRDDVAEAELDRADFEALSKLPSELLE